jgi:hypothetical protein
VLAYEPLAGEPAGWRRYLGLSKVRVARPEAPLKLRLGKDFTTWRR